MMGTFCPDVHSREHHKHIKNSRVLVPRVKMQQQTVIAALHHPVHKTISTETAPAGHQCRRHDSAVPYSPTTPCNVCVSVLEHLNLISNHSDKETTRGMITMM